MKPSSRIYKILDKDPRSKGTGANPEVCRTDAIIRYLDEIYEMAEDSDRYIRFVDSMVLKEKNNVEHMKKKTEEWFNRMLKEEFPDFKTKFKLVPIF